MPPPPPTPAPDAWPPVPGPGKDVVLHTRVVTETGGGPDKTIIMSAPFLAHTNYWLASAYMHPPNDPGFEAVRSRAEAAKSPLISVPDRGPLDGSVLRRMLAICRRYNVRIWHGHDYKSNLLGLMLRPLWSMKLVTTVHGWVKQTTRTPLYYAVDRWCLPYYHHVICVSDDLMEQMRKIGVRPDRCTLIENGIDQMMFTRHYPAAQSLMRKRLGTPAGRLVVGAVGRLSAEKAFNNLIHATHELVREGLDIELWIAGEGDARGDLEKLIDGLQMRGRVRLLGFVKDTIELYHALDLFALSSLREGLPNVVLEAMSMEVPVVSTKVAGVPRLITDGRTGLLCEMGDVHGLAQAMRRAIADDDLRQRLAAAGRALIESQYSFAARMEKERRVYDRVLGMNTPSPQAGASAANAP